ncbi:conserved hypothetical protein [Methylocella tundrae]|uniref:Uncharacterized protein n=1 Tax=Methylocella tundrae TaxID=227605 RepID=A0A8B6M3V5_METTU|nr:hypothetical protein [Methylocella tundrae]VTZ27853.1 conserved hypothetical protein [Methylocella tundrae]VTZ49486.1 conserved hypothetical protein [Methylocella tundrae]
MRLTDKARVELALPALVMFDVMTAGVDDPASPEAREAIDLFAQAAEEPFADLLPPKRRSLERRAERLFEDVMRQHRQEGALVAKAGLVWFYALQRIVAQDYLVLHEGSAMARGMDLIMPALQPAANEPALNRSAEKQAVRLLKRLNWLGYYEGVSLDAADLAA